MNAVDPCILAFNDSMLLSGFIFPKLMHQNKISLQITGESWDILDLRETSNTVSLFDTNKLLVHSLTLD